MCTHSKFENIEIDANVSGSSLWNYECGYGICVDCGEKMRVYRSCGKLTHAKSKWSVIKKYDCTHSDWTVPTSTIKTVRSTTLGGTFARLLLGPSMDGIQYKESYEGIAKCSYCAEEFPVESEIRAYYKNKVIINEPVKWRIIKKEK